MCNKLVYSRFCEINDEIPIYFNDWWLDVVCGKDNWKAIVIESGGFVKAICPLKVVNRKFGFKQYSMPHFTPFLGVYFQYPEGQKYSTKLSYEKEVINEILKQIGDIDSFFIKFHSGFTNWLPFYWNKFEQTTYYTYRLFDIKNNDVFLNFQDNIKREIRKAQKKGVAVEEIDSLDDCFDLLKKTYLRQGKNMNFSFDDLKKIDEKCKEKKCRKILIAKDLDGNIHCFSYYIWDKKSMYYVIGGSDTNYRTSGAASLVMYEAIKVASMHLDVFDFEGSMIESVERFFRGFGAIQIPIFCIQKYSNREKMFQKLLKIKKIFS